MRTGRSSASLRFTGNIRVEKYRNMLYNHYNLCSYNFRIVKVRNKEQSAGIMGQNVFWPRHHNLRKEEREQVSV